jgi:hypothetical protein
MNVSLTGQNARRAGESDATYGYRLGLYLVPLGSALRSYSLEFREAYRMGCIDANNARQVERFNKVA